MNLKDIANQIPATNRKSLLEENNIYKSVIDRDDYDMQILWILYSNFIEPYNELYTYKNDGGNITINGTCNICLGNIKQKFIEMQPYLVELEKEYNLIHSI